MAPSRGNPVGPGGDPGRPPPAQLHLRVELRGRTGTGRRLPRGQSSDPPSGRVDPLRGRAPVAAVSAAAGPLGRSRAAAGSPDRRPVEPPSPFDRGGHLHQPTRGVADGFVLSAHVVWFHSRGGARCPQRACLAGDAAQRVGDNALHPGRWRPSLVLTLISGLPFRGGDQGDHGDGTPARSLL